MKWIRLFFPLAVATALALTIVWQSALVRHEGYRAAELRSELERERAEHRRYVAQVSRLKSPSRILPLVKALGLELVPAPIEQELPEAPSRDEAHARDEEVSPG